MQQLDEFNIKNLKIRGSWGGGGQGGGEQRIEVIEKKKKVGGGVWLGAGKCKYAKKRRGGLGWGSWRMCILKMQKKSRGGGGGRGVVTVFAKTACLSDKTAKFQKCPAIFVSLSEKSIQETSR